jgi:hypothetical protein
MAGTSGLGALIGLVGGTISGAKCGILEIGADIEHPPVHVRRVFEQWHTGRFINGVNERIAALTSESSIIASSTATLELQDLVVVVTGVRAPAEGQILCGVRLTASVKWSVIRSTDKEFLDGGTSKAVRGGSSVSVDRWLHNDEAMREDIGWLLDDLVAAIAADLSSAGISIAR